MKRPPLKDRNESTGFIGVGPIPGQSPVASFNKDGIENLLRTKGFLAFHYKHALNPDRNDINAPANPNTQASFRGLRYYDPRPVYHVPQQYRVEDLMTAQAVYERGSALFNITGQYYDSPARENSIVHLRPRDLLIFPTLTDFSQQLFEYNPTGPQKLQYKVKSVDFIFDNDAEYIEGRDFVITEDGLIEWIKGGIRPEFKNGKGSVCSIVYGFNPIYVVWDMLHNLRVIPSNNQGYGALPRDAVYAPQQVVVKPSTIIEENDVTEWRELPPLPEYPASKNTTGGSS